jgi:hypothetical protein
MSRTTNYIDRDSDLCFEHTTKKEIMDNWTEYHTPNLIPQSRWTQDEFEYFALCMSLVTGNCLLCHGNPRRMSRQDAASYHCGC